MVACFFSEVGKECGFQISSRKRDARLFCSPYAYQGSGFQQVSTSQTCQTGLLTYYDGRWHPYLLDIDMHRHFLPSQQNNRKCIRCIQSVSVGHGTRSMVGNKELDCQTESAWSGDPETFDGFNCCGKCAGRFENLGADCSKPEVEEWVAGFICYYLNLSLDHGMSNVKLEYRPLQSICKASAFSLAQFCPDILAVARLGHHKSFDRMESIRITWRQQDPGNEQSIFGKNYLCSKAVSCFVWVPAPLQDVCWLQVARGIFVFGLRSTSCRRRRL